MNLVQIATSKEYGAYYYDFSTSKIFYVPHDDLLELNNVRFSNLTGWFIGSLVVTMGIIGYVKNLQFDHSSSLLFLLVLIASIVSSALLCWLVKSNQKRISCLIRDRYRTAKHHLNLVQALRHGRKIYVQLSIYVVILFIMAFISLGISLGSSDILFALFTIVFFDSGTMMTTILQPFGKIAAYFRVKKTISDHGFSGGSEQ